MAKKYIEVNGTSYDATTDSDVVSILERCRKDRTRIVVYYGNKETGCGWGYKVVGRVGRSTGSVKIPLILYNSRSLGGEGILDDCIVRIEMAKGKNQLYSWVDSNGGSK